MEVDMAAVSSANKSGPPFSHQADPALALTDPTWPSFSQITIHQTAAGFRFPLSTYMRTKRR
jgi:hypothetical protein